MKIKNRALSYDEVLDIRPEPHLPPKRPSMFYRTLLKVLSKSELRAVDFTCTRKGMERLGPEEPALFLMNHSSFIDLKIAASILYPRPFNIVCTSDGFVGKKGLMRSLGCIPTKKFIMDTTLVRDLRYAVDKLHDSVLLYPEAGYSFDGTATTLPASLGKLLKMLRVPVVMIKSSGAFLRDPLYNMLQLRKVKVNASVTYVLSPEEIQAKSVDELNAILKELFTFDNFKEQQERHIRVDEVFRADGLNRVLYKCPVCLTEGETEGKGTHLRCRRCGKVWELDEYGRLGTEDGEPVFSHIPDWYAWERDCVRKELEEGRYRMELPVVIRMLVDSKCLYTVGEGTLTHTAEGFHLTGCGGKLDYCQSPVFSYSLNADYFWYELGDMISIGDINALYYCFPKTAGDVVAKARLAAEELFKMQRPVK